MDVHVCPGAIVIEGRNRQMLAAALLNQSVSQRQSSPAIEHQRDAVQGSAQPPALYRRLR